MRLVKGYLIVQWSRFTWNKVRKNKMLKYNFQKRIEYVKNRKIYIWGCGEIGQYVYELVDNEKILGFIDNDVDKQGKVLFDKKIFGIDDIKDCSDILFVIGVSDSYYRDVKQQLEKTIGVVEEQVIYYLDYLPVYEYYVRDTLFFNLFSVSVTQKCSLNCKNCSIMTPYLKNKKHYPIERLKEDLSLFFDKFDLLGNMSIVGGEPFLYPDFVEYLDFVGRYRDRIIRKPQIVTNGTIIPGDEVLKKIREYNFEVSISDYRKGIPVLAKKIESLIEKLEKYDIKYFVNTVDQWVDFGYTTVNRSDASEDDLTSFYNECEMPCKLLRDKCLYQCANAQFAVDAGLIKEDLDNNLYLEKIVDEDARKKAVLFDLRFQKKGYLTLCRHCNGYVFMNKHYIDVAEQI